MDAFINSVIQLLIDWGIPGLFLSALLAGSIVPFSSELVLVALVEVGLSPVTCVLAAALGNTLGGMTCYYMGHLGKVDWIEKYFKVKKEKKMQEVFDIHTIKFVKETDIIEEIEDGYSGALLYKITRGKDKFFLKVFIGAVNIEKIKKCVSIYKELNIKSLDIIDFGNIDNLEKYYIVYNIIEGENLKSYTKSERFTLEDVRKMGTIIGKELLKLRNYKDYNNELFISDNIHIIVDNAKNNFNLLLENKAYRDVILKYFSIEEINDLKNKLEQYCNIFKYVEQRLIHGDIKRSNIMVNQNGEFYITDIESMQVNYDVLNFRYQITWSLFEGSEKEAEFVKGYFDGIYSNTRPENFNYSIIFTIILNFFSEAHKRYRCSNISGFETYVQKCKKLFEKVKQIDLEKEYIV